LIVFCILYSAITPVCAQDRIELCRCDNATVYSRYLRTGETETANNYQIIIEIENDSFDNLYYARKVRIRADEKDPFIPPYLTVSIANPAVAGKDEQFLIHGGVTMHMSSDSTQIFRITMKRNEHQFKSRIRKGESPQVRCYFNEDLIPWEKVQLLKLKLKP
jgi:hypothetical protein